MAEEEEGGGKKMFEASEKFVGARRGYEYKAGALGIGYYRTEPAQSAVL